MSNRNKILTIGGVFLLGLACGRYSLPSKIVESDKEKDVKQEQKQTDQKVDKNKVTIVKEVKSPDGTITKTTTVVDKSVIDTDTHNKLNEQKDIDKEKITTYDTSSLKASLLISKSFETGHYTDPLVYGIGIDKKVLGPIWMGAFGYTNRNLGVSFGLMF